MLELNDSMDQLAVVNSVCWYGHVLIGALQFGFNGRKGV